MAKLLCIYHANCQDGFGSAWVVRERCKRDGIPVEFYAATHQNPPPDVRALHVVIVDFSFKRPVLMEMATVARSILIIDHHKSAAEDLADFAPPAPYSEWKDADTPLVAEADVPIAALFNMDHSGAGLAWNFFFQGEDCPPLIAHIEDRDLWRFNLPGTREIAAALFSYPYDFDVWDGLINGFPGSMLEEGSAIERKHHKDVAELVAATKRTMVIAGFTVPVASLPYTYSSDAGHLMCKPDGDHVPPFAACYWDTPNGRVFSLRSDDAHGAVDVAAVAKSYGGGGHRNASGFRMPIGWEGDVS